MAAITLGIVGNAVLPGIGGFIGAIVGSLIDSYLLFPALFPPDTIQGPRLDDIQVQTASEGSPMKWVLGPRNRVAGSVIWMSDLIEVARESGSKMGPSQVSYTYYVDIAIGVCDTTKITVNRIKKFWADVKVILDENGPTNKYESLTFYDGTQTTPDPLIESYRGVGDTPSYNGTAVIVIERLYLGDYGNRVPNMTSLLEQNPDVSLGDAIGYILERTGFEPSEYDVTRLHQCFKGMIVSGVSDTTNVLAPLILGYAITMQESDGKLLFFSRGRETVITVDEDDLAARQPGSSDGTPHQLRKTDINSYELPDQVDIRFISTDKDLQQGADRDRKINHPIENTVTMDLPLTLHPIEAKALCRQVLWSSEAERVKVEFSLPPSYIEVQEGDAVSVTVDGEDHYIMLGEINRGSNFEIRAVGVLMQPHVYEQLGFAQAAPISGTHGAYRPSATFGEFFDGPALTEGDITRIGGYFAICLDGGTLWRGAEVWHSADDTTYTILTGTGTEATMGTVLLAPGVGPSLFPDTVNLIEIELANGTVQSCSDEEFLRAVNVCAIQTIDGNYEYIGFRDVTVLGSGRYRLGYLARGVRGTEHLIDKHLPTGARFILLRNNGSVGFVDLGSAALGTDDYYKFPALEGLVSDYPRHGPVEILGQTMRPFSPVNLLGEWDADTNDFTLEWTRRSKRFASPYGPGAGGLSADETPETYIIEFRVGGDLSDVIRTKTVTTASCTYTEAEQTTDGLTPAGTISLNCHVYQLSQVVGRSIVAKESFFP